MLVPRFVQQALRGGPLTVYDDGQQTRCFCDVRDTVRAIVGLAECSKAVGQVFNIGTTDEISILELAHKVFQALDELKVRPPVLDSKTVPSSSSLMSKPTTPILKTCAAGSRIPPKFSSLSTGSQPTL